MSKFTSYLMLYIKHITSSHLYLCIVYTLSVLLFTSNSYSQSNKEYSEFIDLYKVASLPNTKPEQVFTKYYRGLETIENVPDSLRYEFYKHFHWYYRFNGYNKECLKTGLKALKYAKEKNHFFNITSFTEHISRAYIKEAKIDSALYLNYGMLNYYDKHLNKIKKESADLNKRLIESAVSGYNNVGVFYYQILEKKDSAYYFFQKALDFPRIESKQYKFLSHSIKDNIALIHLDKGNFDKAKTLFEQNFQFYKNKDIERWIRAGLQLSISEIHIGLLNNANNLLVNLNKEMESEGNYPGKTENTIMYNKALEFLYVKRNDFKKAKIFADRANVLEQEKLEFEKRESDKKLRLYNDASLQRARTLINKEKQLLKNEKKMRNILLIVLITVIIITGFTLNLLNVRSKLKLQNAKAEKQIEEEKAKFVEIKNELLQKEIDFKRRDLTLFANTISENQKWNDYLLKKIKNDKASSEEVQQNLIASLEEEIKDRIKIEQSNLNFHNRIDMLNSEFYENLLKEYPNLTKTELKLCSLIRLNLDNKEIATMQNISKDSVYRSRTRLRKKLKLSQDVDLNIFLKSF